MLFHQTGMFTKRIFISRHNYIPCPEDLDQVCLPVEHPLLPLGHQQQQTFDSIETKALVNIEDYTFESVKPISLDTEPFNNAAVYLVLDVWSCPSLKKPQNYLNMSHVHCTQQRRPASLRRVERIRDKTDKNAYTQGQGGLIK